MATVYRDLPYQQDGCDDLNKHFQLLYETCYYKRPQVVVELGVRGGNSTRVLATALHHAGSGLMVSFDPTVMALPWRKPFQDAQVVHSMVMMTGEEAYKHWPKNLFIDLMFIDTDPHTYEQTLGWLQTWVRDLLAPDGVAMFHDTEIHGGVAAALKTYVGLLHPHSYDLEFDRRQMGMGILRAKGGEKK